MGAFCWCFVVFVLLWLVERTGLLHPISTLGSEILGIFFLYFKWRVIWFFFFGPLSPATFQNPSIPSFLFSIISASSPFPLLAKFLIEFLQSWHAKVFLEGYFKCFTLWCETLTFFMFLSCIILEKQIQDAGTGGLCQISPVNIFREMRKLAVLKPSAQLQSGPSLILSHHPVLSALCYYSSFCWPNLESI